MSQLDDDQDVMAESSGRRPRHAQRVPDDVAQDINSRFAAMRVRYLADQHGCQAHRTGKCDHPNHRRDMDLLHTMLSMLGLDTDYPAYTQAEARTWLKWIRQSGPVETDDLAA